MLKFYKKKTQIDETETGDFYGFDANILYDILKPLNARCDTAEVEITVYPIDDTEEFDETAITNAVLLHGSNEQVIIRARIKEAQEFNKPIKFLPEREGEINYISLDITKAKKDGLL